MRRFDARFEAGFMGKKGEDPDDTLDAAVREKFSTKQRGTQNSILKKESNYLRLHFSRYLTIIRKMFKYTKRTMASGVLCLAIAATGGAQLQAKLSTTYPTTSSALRRAERIARRLEKAGHAAAPSTPELVRAVEWQEALRKRSVDLIVQSDDGRIAERWTLSLQTSPHWIRGTGDGGSFEFAIDRASIASDLRGRLSPIAPAPVDATVTAVAPDARGVLRATIEGIARGGYVADVDAVSREVASALENGTEEVTLALEHRDGRILNATTYDLGDLRLLSVGHSDFAGSGAGRKINVRKALNEHLDGIVIQPGESFSFNAVLGPVTPGNGWADALVIFNGTDLQPAPGGGICQVATTLFRAVLQGGFPITARANHSLYVTYYEKYGVGLDATVFPGKQDFRFTNDTAGPLLVQSYNDGDEAFVNIYGISDNRRTVLEGPYFQSTEPQGLFGDGKHLRGSEIAWVQRVIHGEAEARNVILSHYNAIPRSLPAKYPVASILVRTVALSQETNR